MNPTILQRFRDYAALTKPNIVLMSVLMASGGFLLPEIERLEPRLFLGTLLGIALAVGSANTLNMAWERDVDARMARTRLRPLPAGRLGLGEAVVLGLTLGILSMIALIRSANALTALLGAFALLVYVLGYTPLKRHSPLALLVGAVPGAAPPLMGWTAATGRIDLPGLALFAILLAWQIPHFIAIALFRREDYARAGILTVPLANGDFIAKLQALAFSTALLPLSVLPVPLGAAGGVYLSTALALGLGFWGLGLAGFRAESAAPWARRYFFASLIYLPVLCLGLTLDHLVR